MGYGVRVLKGIEVLRSSTVSTTRHHFPLVLLVSLFSEYDLKSAWPPQLASVSNYLRIIRITAQHHSLRGRVQAAAVPK